MADSVNKHEAKKTTPVPLAWHLVSAQSHLIIEKPGELWTFALIYLCKARQLRSNSIELDFKSHVLHVFSSDAAGLLRNLLDGEIFGLTTIKQESLFRRVTVVDEVFVEPAQRRP